MRIRGGFLTALLFVLSSALTASAQPPPPPQVGMALPPGFPVIENPYLGVPIIGFGARSLVRHVPIIFLHGNNDSPFPTVCNPYGSVHAFAQYFADNGYQLSELWALGYQGDQCDLEADPTLRSGVAHGTAAAVNLLRKFVAAVMASTLAPQVDIVAHSLGVTVAREWMLEDNAYGRVRRLVAIDGPNHGITDCSPATGNYFQLPADGDFVPNSSICEEYGAADTPFLTALNAGGETPGPTKYLVIRNVFDASPESGDFVYIGGEQDGPFFPPVPAEDRNGNAHDFSDSALLAGAQSIDLTGQGAFDHITQTAHLGILASPTTWQDTFNFVSQDFAGPLF